MANDSLMKVKSIAESPHLLFISLNVFWVRKRIVSMRCFEHPKQMFDEKVLLNTQNIYLGRNRCGVVDKLLAL